MKNKKNWIPVVIFLVMHPEGVGSYDNRKTDII